MHFAEGADVARRAEQDCRIVECGPSSFGDAGDDIDVVVAGCVDPGSTGFAGRHFLGELESFGPITKNVARIGELRQHDQAGAVECRLSDPFQAFDDVGLLGAHDRLHLNAGNRDLALHARSVAHRQFPKSEQPEATRGLSAAAVTLDGNSIQLSSDGGVKLASV